MQSFNDFFFNRAHLKFCEQILYDAFKILQNGEGATEHDNVLTDLAAF